MPDELDDAVVVDFPLRGEGWMAVTTPATRIPSHGVDALGQRFAYDFLKVDRRDGAYFHPASALRMLLVGARTRDCYAWGAAVHAPFDGEVVAAVDGMPERQWIHPIREVVRQIVNGLTFTPSRMSSILGNHVILRSGDVFAGFVHLAPASVRVVAGQRVHTGDPLGRIGHTGNSTSPHLHFQLMDRADPLTAKGSRAHSAPTRSSATAPGIGCRTEFPVAETGSGRSRPRSRDAARRCNPVGDGPRRRVRLMTEERWRALTYWPLDHRLVRLPRGLFLAGDRRSPGSREGSHAEHHLAHVGRLRARLPRADEPEPARGTWFRKHIFDLLVVLLPVLRPLKLLRVLTMATALKRTVGTALRTRIIVYGSGAAILLIWMGSLAVLEAERGAPGANIVSFGDAIWWACVTITTWGMAITCR